VAFEISPFRALRFCAGAANGTPVGAADLSALVAPPYDVISAEEHRALLDRSPHNIVRLTLGDKPGERARYEERARLLAEWRERMVLVEEREPGLFVYGVDYAVPGSQGRRASFRGLLTLGSLHEFAEKIVLPHERTFPDVVDDRYRLLDATRTHLELILLLYADPKREIDAILLDAARSAPDASVAAKPGETHALWAVRDPRAVERLRGLFCAQRPIIADGHHRYTTSCLYQRNRRSDPKSRAGTGWQPMVLGNLFGEGLSILATHRLAALGGREREALRVLDERLERASEGAPADLEVETRETTRRFAIPRALRAARRGVGATDYAILHDVILGDWLAPFLAQKGAGEGAAPILYFKEGTGEREALRARKGDALFRMRPVRREEFQAVVEGGEVFPHKTTFFYPKLWSGLALWALAEPGAAT